MIRFKINWYGILLTLFFVPGTLVCQMTDGVVLAPNNSPSFSSTGPNAAENGEDGPRSLNLTLNGENNRRNAIRYRYVGGPDPVSR